MVVRWGNGQTNTGAIGKQRLDKTDKHKQNNTYEITINSVSKVIIPKLYSTTKGFTNEKK